MKVCVDNLVWQIQPAVLNMFDLATPYQFLNVKLSESLLLKFIVSNKDKSLYVRLVEAI